MRKAFQRKFKFEGDKEWKNPFWTTIASMFIVVIFLTGFYNSNSNKMYKTTDSMEAKAVIETLGFTANYIKDNINTLTPTDPSFVKSTKPHIPTGYPETIQKMIDEIAKNDKSYERILHTVGPKLIAYKIPKSVAKSKVQIYARHFQQGQETINKKVVVEGTHDINKKQFLKATRFKRGKYDITRVLKSRSWEFNSLAKLSLFYGIFIIFIILAFIVAKMMPKNILRNILLIIMFAIFSVSSLVLSINFSKADYLLNKDKLIETYNSHIRLVETTLKENYNVKLTPAEYKKLITLYNFGMSVTKRVPTQIEETVIKKRFGKEVELKRKKTEYKEVENITDKFVYKAPNEVAISDEGIEAKVKPNATFIIIGWIIGLILGILLLIFFTKKRKSGERGFERFLNTMYNFSTAYLFVAPGILGMLILVFIPIIFTVVLGFTALPKYMIEIDIVGNFVGFANFGEILGTFDLGNPRNFYYTLGFTFLFTVVAVALQVFVGILIAVLLHENDFKIKGFYQVMFMLPWIIPTFITGLVWGYFFGVRGVLDQVMTVANNAGVVFNSGWFQDPVAGFFIVSFVAAWYVFPFIMLVTLSALQTIPKSVYEAALIDGANWFQTLFHITLPMIRGTVLPSVLLTSIWTFNNFNMVYLVTGGNDRFDILITRIYDFVQVPAEIASQYGWTYGYAATYSALIFIVLLGYITIFVRTTNLTEKSF